ncbi:MAG: alpha/beta hydrolase [Leptolyngbya sp. SIO1D8]|nr:alpha/beta hydrolase [Leptolyngbya sp. SIO1D8]
MKILLVHGLNRTSLSLINLEWHFQALGWQTEQFSYFAFIESFNQISIRLRKHIRILANQGPYGIVAHSLGGLLIRAALGQTNIHPPVHVVMLGTPNQSPRLAHLAWQLPPFQWLTGQCGFNLTQSNFFTTLPKLRSPYTIVAGNRGPRGRFSLFGDEANDGIVAVSETLLSTSDRLIELPVEHTFMMNDVAVQASVVEAIKQSKQQ